MGATITEKIIVAAAGIESVKPRGIHTVNLDRPMSNDGTIHLTIDMHRNQLKRLRIADASRLVFIADHNVLADNPKTATFQKKMQDLVREDGVDFWEGKGVYRQIMTEHYVHPGELIFGADNHTRTYRALRTSGTGVGRTDYLYGMVTRTSWALVPEIVEFNLAGKLRPKVYPRDLILATIDQMGANGCNYQVMEFTGEGVKALNASDRMALCSLAVEAETRTGIVGADEITLEYLKEHGRMPRVVYHNDENAVYMREYTFDLSKIEPVTARPDFADDVTPASGIAGIAIDEAFLSFYSNGRVDDLRVGTAVIRGKKMAEHVRFLVVPASNDVYQQAFKEGLIGIFMKAGAIVMNTNCSVCWGSRQGVIGGNKILIGTGTRDFKGRAGHPNSKVYPVSVTTVAASTVAGVITMVDQLI